MLNELRDFIKRCELKPLRTQYKGRIADAAVETGMKYFRENGRNYAAHTKVVQDAVRSLSRIQLLEEFGAPKREALMALNAIQGWGGSYILAGEASTYAALFKQGQTNRVWTAERQQAAKEACEFFKI